jgi:hypothetical protein
MTTVALLAALNEMQEAPWNDLQGRPLDARRLSTRLRQYGIKPQVIRVGDATPRGYRREDFVDAWQRYLTPPSTPGTSATSATSETTQQNQQIIVADAVADGGDVADPRPKDHRKFNGVADVADVAAPATYGEGGGDVRCAQCNGLHDGKERVRVVGDRTVWLHRECERFWRAANKTG